MLTVTNLNIQYGDKHIFRDVSARINDQDRIGLVGVNGAGKSTLLKIMAGLIETDANTVSRVKRTTVAYLPQEASSLTSGLTIYQEAETAFSAALVMQQDLEAVNRELATLDQASADFSVLLRRQAELQHRLDGTDLFRVRSQIEKVLVGLGFRESDFDRDSRELSGGWLMRLQLAKLLLARPSLLMLDEPTNHLDLDSLTWLENFLLTHEGALIIISHDRTFLDRVTSITWELSLGKLTVFKGNYSRYVAEKEVRLQVERAAYENQQAQIRQTMRFVQRFRAKSTKAKQVQSRLRQLSKMERVDLSETAHSVAFRFPPAAECGKSVIEVRALAKAFDGRPVFSDVGFQLLRGDKMAVVGVNGAGKSTLMRILAGLDSADEGEVRLGYKVQLSYFGQHQAQELDPGLTALETVARVAGNVSVTETRSLLGAFLFRGDEVEKPVQVLSGGEKSRLALAKMIVQPANLLVLDEPTNHLDMSSQEVLQEAMVQYDGAIIIVSHNRYFVNRFINKVLEIKNGRATVYEGNIDDYLHKVQAAAEAAAASTVTGAGRKEDGPATAVAESSESKKNRGKSLRQEQARVRQQKSERLGPLKKMVQQAEQEIEALEDRKKELEEKMVDPQLYKHEEAFAQCSREYQTITSRLDRQYYKWEEAQAKIEEIERHVQLRYPYGHE